MPEDYHRPNSCQLSAPHNISFRRQCGSFAAIDHVAVDSFRSLHLATTGRSTRAAGDCRSPTADLRAAIGYNTLRWQNEMLEWSAYLGLFLAAFGAATILPFQSEPVLVGLLLAGEFSPVRLILVASVGNVLGAAVNWGLGRCIERYRDKSWFPVKEPQLQRAEGWYRRFGRWSLLLSWMPLFGDALTVLSGVLREPFWSFLILVSIAKAGRYVVLAFATLGVQAILGF